MRRLTDAEAEEIERNHNYRRWEGKCPLCDNTGTYKWKGQEYECELDDRDRHVQRELMRHYCLANLPNEHVSLKWEEFPQQDLREEIDDYVANFSTVRKRGLGLEMMGKHGIGKTWAAAHVLQEVLKQGYTGYFIMFASLKGLWDNPDRDRILAHVRESELLVVDDLLRPYGEGKMTAFYEEKLEAVLRERTMYNLPTITTTNMSHAEMEQFFPRVYTILAGKQIPMEFKDIGDYRLQVRESFEYLREGILNGETPPLC